MKKNLILMCSLFVAMTFGACTENDAPVKEGAKTDFAIELNFDGANTKATTSTAIPVTSWNIIKEVQFLLYGADGIVKFSAVESPTTGAVDGTGKKYVYTSVPEGTYTLVAVASTVNKDMTNIVPFGATANAPWDRFNVLDKNISALYMTHKPIAAGFPAFVPTEYKNEMDAYSEPAEIFMGSVSVTVAPNTTNNATVSLKREVSLMRVRLNVKANTDVSFTQEASILVRHLPSQMKVQAGNTGGVSATSVVSDVLVVSGPSTFNIADPTTGYSAGGKILDAVNGFSMWKDIVVFPNYNGRADAALTADADGARRYLIAISGHADAGHVLADGTSVGAGGATVYWYGTVVEKFSPNVIRDVNVTLNTGGYTDLPITELGDLTITVSEPAPWDSNIVVSDVSM